MTSINAPEYPLAIKQGADFELAFQLTQPNSEGGPGAPIDLTGWALSAQVRPSEPEPVALAFTVEIVAAVEGRCKLKATDTQTNALSFRHYVWDFKYRSAAGFDGMLVRTSPVEVELAVTR